MSSPSPSTRKRIGRGVCNFDSGVGHREKQKAVLSGIYAKFTQNPAITKSPCELRQQDSGWVQPYASSVGHWSPGG